MEPGAAAVHPPADDLGGQHPQGEGQHGQEVPPRSGQLPQGEPHGQLDEIPRLGGGKDRSPGDEAVRVQHPPGEGQQQPHRQGVGHLFFLGHALTPRFSCSHGKGAACAAPLRAF